MQESKHDVEGSLQALVGGTFNKGLSGRVMAKFQAAGIDTVEAALEALQSETKVLPALQKKKLLPVLKASVSQSNFAAIPDNWSAGGSDFVRSLEASPSDKPFAGCRTLDVGGESSGECGDVVLLLVGPSGSGKTTLVNAVMNYYYGVAESSDYRLQLVGTESGEPTTEATVYRLPFLPNCRLPSQNLVIVDTPGVTSGGDNSAVEQLLAAPSLHTVALVAKWTTARLDSQLRATTQLLQTRPCLPLVVVAPFASGGPSPLTKVLAAEGAAVGAPQCTVNNGALLSETPLPPLQGVNWHCMQEGLAALFAFLGTAAVLKQLKIWRNSDGYPKWQALQQLVGEALPGQAQAAIAALKAAKAWYAETVVATMRNDETFLPGFRAKLRPVVKQAWAKEFLAQWAATEEEVTATLGADAPSFLSALSAAYSRQRFKPKTVLEFLHGDDDAVTSLPEQSRTALTRALSADLLGALQKAFPNDDAAAEQKLAWFAAAGVFTVRDAIALVEQQAQ